MMQRYRVVNDVVQIPAWQEVLITLDQLNPRRRAVEVIDVIADDRFPSWFLVRPTQPLQFKVGELIGLADASSRYLQDRLVVDDRPL